MAKQKLRKVFADNLRQEREKSGLTQREIARLTKLHRTYVSSIERGERNVSIDNIEKIAKALGLKPAKLMRD